jgi:hypothetical protein
MHKISPVGSLLTHKIYPNQLFKIIQNILVVICTYIHVNKYITLVSLIFNMDVKEHETIKVYT